MNTKIIPKYAIDNKDDSSGYTIKVCDVDSDTYKIEDVFTSVTVNDDQNNSITITVDKKKMAVNCIQLEALRCALALYNHNQSPNNKIVDFLLVETKETKI